MEVPQVIVNTLSELLHYSASRWPERVAVADAAGGRALTYRNLDALVTDLTAQLHRHGVGKGDSVALASDNCLEYVLALFAVVGVRASAAPLNPALTAPQVVSALSNLHARATIVPAHLDDEFVTTHGTSISATWKLTLAPGQHGDLRAELDAPQISADGSTRAGVPQLGPPLADDVAILLLTSGTTAAPKVVPLTHGNLLASIDGIRTAYRLTPDDATLLVMPLYHGHGLIAGLLATLASGGAGYLPTGGRFHAGAFWSDMVTAQATWYTAVPTIHQILLARAGSDYPRDGYPDLRFVRSCSAALAPEVLQDVEAAFSAPVLPAYGMTETAHQVSSNPLPSDGVDKPASVGLGTGVDIQITGPGGGPALSGETGEVWVRGPAVTSGYLNNPAATAESFSGGWFHTGDLGYQDADGYLFLTGRIKEIINRGGEKISPSVVDEVLQSNPDVEDAVSFGVPDEKYGEEIEAAVVLRPGHTVGEDELRQYARSRLSAFEVPKRIFFMADLPRTAKGAGDRRRLATLLGRRN
jgi:acyl-CoA synthetase (AMP-forming)/AMP-acid ligase II